MAEVSLSETFLHTFEGAVSVLFTLLAGYIVARKDYVDHDTIRRLSRLSSSVFLPCLIIVQMGPEITIPNLARLWIIPLWGLVSTIIAHLVGWLGQVVFKLPHWTIVAAGRPNANALPLLLIQSLRYTGVLDHLSPGESVNKILDRAKSLILLNAVVQQTLTFQFAPAVLRLDKNSSNGKGSCERSRPVVHESDSRDLPDVIQDTERVGLLHDCEHSSYGGREEREEFPSALNPIADQPDIHWPLWLLPSQRIVEKVYGWMSAPLIGAIIAILFGIIPPLHVAFLDRDGAFYSSVTQSIANLGDLFVVIQTVIVGAELALVPHANPGVFATGITLCVRFLVMPALSLFFVWTTAGRGWYIDDKLVWFLLILIPSGPSAMLLANVAEMVNVDQGPIARYLTISYLVSPIIAIVCALGLMVVENISF